ncbi:MAG: aldose epimerase family protein [Agathobacter sp.]|nr:aldose epimerase family protein [Agathobacter sp.]
MKTEAFGSIQSGKKATLYILENKNHTVVKVTDFGATLVSVLFADKDGVMKDMVLGYDDAASYEKGTSCFGATIGRNGNRIKDARFTIDGKEWVIEANENNNSLHSGKNGFNHLMWEMKESGDNYVTFYHYSPQEEQGFPGNMHVTVTYTLDDEDTVHITYHAKADADTVMNFTNHSYFNLAGHDSGVMLDQKLQLFADAYTPDEDSHSIPTGEIAPVAGTPMDFTTMKPIGQDINADFEQLHFTGGYDHNYVLSDKPGTMRQMAKAECDASGIAMDAYTECCGVQLYAGNFIGTQTGKGGVTYGDRHGFCLESQFYPNAVNEKNFPSPVVPADTEYHSETKYHFYHI